MMLAAASPLWYLTRGSGVAALVLLTLSTCLGVVTSRRWHSERAPRFVVAGVHRSIALLAVVFVAIHVLTTVLDAYTPIGLLDAFVPFVSRYRPVWLGLGALASDLVLAVVITSLLRARFGYRAWRLTHWLAYAAWPMALVHSLGTGSDARTGWLGIVGFAAVAAVATAVLVRVLRGSGGTAARVLFGTGALLASIMIFVWYRGGPARTGWAARAGTPSSLLRSTRTAPTVQVAAVSTPLPSRFAGNLSGSITQTGSNATGRVTIHVDTRVRGGVRGRLRLTLQGLPSGGGVLLTSSGVAFATAGSSVYEGSVVGLDGSHVSARVSGPDGTIDLEIDLQLDDATNTVSGAVTGARA